MKQYGKKSFVLKNNTAWVTKFLVAAIVLISFYGCTATRKLTAADILSNTELNFDNLILDSATINKDLFPKTDLFSAGILPNPQVVTLVQDFARGILEKEIGRAHLTAELTATNKSKDTLWIKNITATLKLDTLMDLPIQLIDSLKMVPGDNKLRILTQFPIDRRIFKLGEFETVKIIGKMTLALAEDGTQFELDFDKGKKFAPEERQALMDNARNAVLNNIVDDWVSAILP